MSIGLVSLTDWIFLFETVPCPVVELSLQLLVLHCKLLEYIMDIVYVMNL